MQIVHSERVLPEVAQWADELAQIRREVHRYPELRFDTEKTVERIVTLLKRWGLTQIDVETVPGGVIAVVEGDRPGATVALRADIDGLPMNDTSGTAWASCREGCAHTCGHDGHQTWLMGALRHLQANNQFPGRVVGIFQPAEESGEGAQAVVASGVLTKYDVKEIYGAHTEPNLEKGQIGFKEGPLQASVDLWWVDIEGVGTHGGRPHLGIDPIVAGAQIVSAVQTIVSRRVNPIEPSVVSVCSINAGRYEAGNIVPQRLTMSGTSRLFAPAMRDLVETKFRQLVTTIAEANDCTATIRYDRCAPAVNNDPELTRALVAIAQETIGAEHVNPAIDAMLSSEDFSHYQQQIPGVMFRVGVRDAEHTKSVHHPGFDFNDEVLPLVVTLFSTFARRRLQALS